MIEDAHREPTEETVADTAVYRGAYDDALTLQVEFGALGIDVELVLEDEEARVAELRVPSAMHEQVRPLVDRLTAALLEEERAPLVDPRSLAVDAQGRRICFLFASCIGAPLALLLAPFYFAAAREVPPSPNVHRWTVRCVRGSAVLVFAFGFGWLALQIVR